MTKHLTWLFKKLTVPRYALVLGVLSHSFLVANSSFAQQVTFSFGDMDNGLSSITKTVDGLTLTVDNFSAGATVSDTFTPVGFRFGFDTIANQADFTFDRDVRLVSYEITGTATHVSMPPETFSLAQGGTQSTGNATDIVGVFAFSNTTDVFSANTPITFMVVGDVDPTKAFGLNNLVFEIAVVADPDLFIGGVPLVALQDHGMYVGFAGDHLRRQAFSGPASSTQTVASRGQRFAPVDTETESEIVTVGHTEIKVPSYLTTVSCRRKPTRYDWTGWAQGFGYNGSIDGSANIAGLSSNSAGVVAGLDRWVNENVVIGGSIGTFNTNITAGQNLGTADADSMRGSIYAMYRNCDRYVMGIGTYGYTSYDSSRNDMAGTAIGAYDGHEGGAYLEAGRNLRRGSFLFQPLAALQYTHISQAGFTETGTGTLVTVGDTGADSLRISGGGRLVYVKDNVMQPYVEARYAGETLDDDVNVTTNTIGGGGAITTNSPSLGRHFLDLEAGTSLIISDRTKLNAAYGGRYSNSSEAHSGRLQLEVSF